MTGMVPEDVYELTGAADPRLSPDGSTVAFVVQRIDRKESAYRSTIWVASVDDSAPPRAFTAGTARDAEPRWSPDGRSLAFTSTRDKDAAQLYVIPAGGGEPRRLTDLDEDVTSPVWSPDGTRIAFVARVRDRAYEEPDAKKRAPRRVTRLSFKLDDEGWTIDRPSHVFVVPADGSAEPTYITHGDCEDAAPAWSPDGTTIAFASARHRDWDIELGRDIYLVDVEGGEPRRLTARDGTYDAPTWSRDGARVACRFTPGILDEPRHTQIAVVDARSGARTTLTSGLDRNCGPYPDIGEPRWDAEDVVFGVEDRGNTHLYRVFAGGARAPELVAGGERTVTGFDVAGGHIAVTATTPRALPELFVDDVQRTRVGEPFAQARALCVPEHFTAISADGSAVDAWIMQPPGFEPGRRYPTLLCIHGGPYSQYGNGFFDEFQVYAGAGYVVLYANPRGSSGFTEAWARAIRGPANEQGPGWGSVDFEDCMAVVDTALSRFDCCDPDRLGVLGGSYGGYMTSWIVGHTDRFKAACSERAVNDWTSMYGSSDAGWDFAGQVGAFLHEDTEAWRAISPTTYAANIRTPLLLLHSENDLRCAIEQAEQLFTTLRLLRRDVELVRFPEEGHELSRSGSPVHRVMRFEIILEWFARYLKPEVAG